MDNKKYIYDSFENYHPLVNFLYFLAVIIFTILFTHPLFQLISLIIASTYLSLREGLKKSLSSIFKYMLGIILLSVLVNSLFNSQGQTILCYLKSGRPISLESITFGLSSGLVFTSIIIWFKSYNRILSSDKLTYLFADKLPNISLIFSMTLRFIPVYTEKIREISRAQKLMKKGKEDKGLGGKIKNSLSILSIMTTWALENSIETSDSMKARGYGIGARTKFSHYGKTRRDRIVLLVLALLSGFLSYGLYSKIGTMKLFPSIKYKKANSLTLMVGLAYGGLLSLPIVLNVQEEIRWKYIK